jgi:hypothetical protein
MFKENGMNRRLYRRAALIFVIVAIVFWLWFGIGSAIVTEGTAFDWFMYIMMPGGIFILSAMIAWMWNRIGGVILALEGLLALIFVISAFIQEQYTTSTFLLMILTLCLPPLISGILFLIYGIRARLEVS